MKTTSTTNTAISDWNCPQDIFALLSLANEERKDKEFYFETRTQERKYREKIADMGKKISELNEKLKNKI